MPSITLDTPDYSIGYRLPGFLVFPRGIARRRKRQEKFLVKVLRKFDLGDAKKFAKGSEAGLCWQTKSQRFKFGIILNRLIACGFVRRANKKDMRASS